MSKARQEAVADAMGVALAAKVVHNRKEIQ